MSGEIRSGMGQARAWLCASLLVLGVLGGCKSVRPETDSFAALPGLHVDEVFGPSTGSTSTEVRHLERVLRRAPHVSRASEQATALRLAVLHERLGDHARAQLQVTSVLASPPAAGPRARALAWLVKARMASNAGKRPAARRALAQAERLAVDRVTRRWIRSKGATLTAPEHGIPKHERAPRVRPSVRNSAGSLVRRGAWTKRAADPARMTPMGRPTRITVHHAGVFVGESAEHALQLVRSFQRAHMDQRGWGDIGYHFLIARDGTIIEGRSMRYQGAHAGNNATNRGNIGVCILGNFQPHGADRAQRPTTAQLHSLESLVHSLIRVYGIAPRQIFTHQEIHPRGPKATECPGTNLAPFVVGLRNALRLETAAGSR